MSIAPQASLFRGSDALEGFGFDLADSLAGDAEFSADFFEGLKRKVTPFF